MDDIKLLAEAYNKINTQLRLVRYPSHDVDTFLVTTEGGLSLLHDMCQKYGVSGKANCYVFNEKKLMQTPEYHEWIDENKRLAGFLRRAFSQIKTPPYVEPDVNIFPDMLVIGVEIAPEELGRKENAVIAALLKKLGIPVRNIPYGSNKDHTCWLSFVQD